MTQNERILELLRDGPITPMEALRDAKCFRLAARISDLKAQGHDIETTMVYERDTHYARYTLVQPTLGL